MSQLKNDMIHGVFWSAVEKYSSLVVSIIVSVILARILTPNEFGTVAIAMVIISFLQMFCTMGLGPAVIQRKDLTKEDLDVIYTFSLILGTLLSAILFSTSWTVSDFYRTTNLVPVCHILCIQLFFAAANMVPNALLQKNKKFKEIARRTLFLTINAGVLSVVAAWKGLGVYSLLITPVFTAIGIFLWNRRYFRLKIVPPNLAPIKKIFSYSVYQFLFEFCNYFSRNLDKLIIGKTISADALGYYDKSYHLMQLPMNNVSSVLNPVIQPVLSSLQDNMQQMAEKYNKLIHHIAFISFPLGATLYICGDEIILLLYGQNWMNSIPAFKILAISIPLQLILSTSGGIFQACNATKHLFYAGLRNSTMTVVGFIMAAYYYKTIESIAWAWTLTSILCFISTYVDMYIFVFKEPLLEMLKELIWPFICLIIIMLMGLIFDAILPDLHYLLRLLVKSLGVSALVFLLCMKMNHLNFLRL